MYKQLIGKGTFGKIYRTDNDTVIKEVNVKGKLKLYKSIISSYIIAKNFNHKNVIGIKDYDVIYTSGVNEDIEPLRIDIYMDYFPGKSALRLVKVHKVPMGIKLLNILYQIVDGLDYLHSQNIAHRDIKLSNIIIKNDVPIIVDLDTVCTKSNFKGLVGTFKFMDPYLYKSWENKQPLDYFIADIYSLSLTMFVIVNGRMPWLNVDKMNKETLFKIKSENNNDTRIYSDSGISQLDELIETGLNPDISKRNSISTIKNIIKNIINVYDDL